MLNSFFTTNTQAYGMLPTETWIFSRNCCTKCPKAAFPRAIFVRVVLLSILESNIPIVDMLIEVFSICNFDCCAFAVAILKHGHFLYRCSSMLDPKQECERQAGSKKILPPVVTAKFRSMKSFNFKFGRVEIRAKFPKGDWIFPRKSKSLTFLGFNDYSMPFSVFFFFFFFNAVFCHFQNYFWSLRITCTAVLVIRHTWTDRCAWLSFTAMNI